MARTDIPGTECRVSKGSAGGKRCVSVVSVGSAGHSGPPGRLGRAARYQPSLCAPVLLPQKGVFQLSNEDYFIEPLEGVPARPGHAQPHVVYRRQAPERQAEQGDSRAPGTCGVQGTLLFTGYGRGDTKSPF